MNSSDAVLCVVQARMGSTRLPGKVLADLGGRPMLEFLLHRLRGVEHVDVVVATSDLPRDDAVAAVATAAGVGVVRGPEADVLARFGLALDRHPAAHVVRITGDCPLTDPEVVRSVVDLHLEREADYTCNVLPRTYPKGMDVEVIAAHALRTALAEAVDPPEREHVTPFLYRHPERFRLANLRSGADLGDERWTVDTPEDLEAVREIVTRLGPDGRFSWTDVLSTIGRHFVPAPGAVHLRPAGPADRDRLLAWRNDPTTVRHSRTAAAVTDDDHDRWFAARLEDPATRLCIGEVDGEPVGMVRVDIARAVGTISIAIDPTRRGEGLGTAVLRALLETWRSDFQAVRLVADVSIDNPASRRAFLAAGFTPDGVADGFEQLAWENVRA